MQSELLKLAPPPPPIAPVTMDDIVSPPIEPAPFEPMPPETPPPIEEQFVVETFGDQPLAAAAPEPVASGEEREHATRTIAALEQWLDAIHVARADRRP
jgi:hypothetical protein